MCPNVPLQALSSDVGTTSSGEDLEGINLISRITSAAETTANSDSSGPWCCRSDANRLKTRPASASAEVVLILFTLLVKNLASMEQNVTSSLTETVTS